MSRLLTPHIGASLQISHGSFAYESLARRTYNIFSETSRSAPRNPRGVGYLPEWVCCWPSGATYDWLEWSCRDHFSRLSTVYTVSPKCFTTPTSRANSRPSQWRAWIFTYLSRDTALSHLSTRTKCVKLFWLNLPDRPVSAEVSFACRYLLTCSCITFIFKCLSFRWEEGAQSPKYRLCIK